MTHQKPEIEKIKQEWKTRGFSCDLWTDPPGQVWKDFVHSTDELILVLEGEIQLTMQGKIFYPIIGEEILIPAKTAHTVLNLGPTTACWLYGYKIN